MIDTNCRIRLKILTLKTFQGVGSIHFSGDTIFFFKEFGCFCHVLLVNTIAVSSHWLVFTNNLNKTVTQYTWFSLIDHLVHRPLILAIGIARPTERETHTLLQLYKGI